MKSLAVVGSGIAGMACAYFLRDRYHVTLYEKNNYIGGHTNTVTANEDGRDVPIDTGFMVYNDETYPNLIRFFDHLGVKPMDTSMSFGVNNVADNFEVSFTSLGNFFPKASDWIDLNRYRLLSGLKKLFASAKEYLEAPAAENITLQTFLEKYRIDKLTTDKFLLPMTAAIWSTPHDRMLEYPATILFRFLRNHGMLGFSEQFQWKTLIGGSQQYKKKILEKIGSSARPSNPAKQLSRVGNSVRVVDGNGNSQTFDKAIIATHADHALQLLETPTEAERNLLGAFRYNINPVTLHSEENVMPTRKKAWASWNYRYDRNNEQMAGSTHYWMNSLQRVSENRNYFVSVDYDGYIDPSKVHWRTTYEHPRFDSAAIAAQPLLPKLNQEGSIYFCGSYFRYGFHEDAFTSALNVVQTLNDGKDPLA